MTRCRTQWFDDEALLDTGNPKTNDPTYAFVAHSGNQHAVLLQQSAYVRAQTRLGTSTDSYLALSGQDLMAGTLPQQPSESAASYSLRLRQRVVRKNTTLPAIQETVLAFYRSIIEDTRAKLVQAFTLDTAGALDVGGALDVLPPDVPDSFLVPVVNVWDAHVRPDLAAATTDPVKSAPITFGVVVIQIMFLVSSGGFYLGYAHLDIETYLTMPGVFTAYAGSPDPRLTVALDGVIGSGIRPVYLIASSP